MGFLVPNDTNDLAVTTQQNDIVNIKAGLIVVCCTSYKNGANYMTQKKEEQMGLVLT